MDTMPRCHDFRHIDIYVSLLPPTNDHSVAFWTPETMTAPIDQHHPLRPPPILLRDHMIEAYPLPRILGILDLIPNYIHLSLSLLHIPCLFIYPIPPYLSPLSGSLAIAPLLLPSTISPPSSFPPFPLSNPCRPFRYFKPRSSQTAHKAFTNESDRRDKFQTTHLITALKEREGEKERERERKRERDRNEDERGKSKGKSVSNDVTMQGKRQNQSPPTK
jgi:hypothetical protein